MGQCIACGERMRQAVIPAAQGPSNADNRLTITGGARAMLFGQKHLQPAEHILYAVKCFCANDLRAFPGIDTETGGPEISKCST